MIPNFYPHEPQAYLREELAQRQARRPQYSMRAFARDLEISASFLCEFLAGRQGMSRERVLWVARKIGLSSEQQLHFWDLIESRHGRTQDDRKAAGVRARQRTKSDESRLSLDRFHVVADWYYMPLLELLCLTPQPSLKVIAAALNIAPSAVEKAISRLIELGMISRGTEYGGPNYVVSSEATFAGDEGSSEAVQSFHRQSLSRQIEAIEQKSIDERESLAISISIDQSEWPRLRDELRNATLSILSKYATNSSAKDQVVSLSMQAITLVPQSQNRRANSGGSHD